MIIVELYTQNGTYEHISNCHHNNANPRPSQNYQQEVHIPVNEIVFLIIILNQSLLHFYFSKNTPNTEYSTLQRMNLSAPSNEEYDTINCNNTSRIRRV